VLDHLVPVQEAVIGEGVSWSGASAPGITGMIGDTKAEIVNCEPVIMAREDTDPKDLEEWREELLEAFHAQPA
jgi:hypothetical protein